MSSETEVFSVAREAQETRAHITDLVQQEAPALLAYFERRAPIEDAADLLGDTLLVTWRRADDIPQDPVQARMWLYGVARRTLATARRGLVRRRALVARLRDEITTRPPAPAADPVLAEALAALPEIDAEIIRLVHWDGFTLAEVADHLERPAGTIRSRYSRARATLRAALT